MNDLPGTYAGRPASAASISERGFPKTEQQPSGRGLFPRALGRRSWFRPSRRRVEAMGTLAFDHLFDAPAMQIVRAGATRIASLYRESEPRASASGGLDLFNRCRDPILALSRSNPGPIEQPKATAC
jgi:hypothetical protein